MTEIVYRIVFENTVINKTVSVGISPVQEGDTVANIIENADQMMYLAKSSKAVSQVVDLRDNIEADAS